MGMPGGRQSRVAQSAESRPAGTSDGTAFSKSRPRRSPRAGSRELRNSASGRPPHSLEYIALWPAAQTLRVIAAGSVFPASTAGTQSANSTQFAAASNTARSTRRQCHTLDQNHSEE